jgi:glutathione-specific gamma-glutamylcyclotransferase
MPPLDTVVKLTRDKILNGSAFSSFRAREGHPPVWSEQQLAASLEKTLSEAPVAGEDIWLFGYGSLIWNPAFRHVETRVARIQGWHRRFCLWTSLMRGSPERPGLVLGLDRGGSCKGVAFRIPAADVVAELMIVWRREMVNGAYEPRWLDIHCPGHGVVRGLTFTVNRRHQHYAGRLPDESVASALATAIGCFGPCAEYFFSTLHALQELGIDDARLRSLRDRVLVHKHAEARHANYTGCGAGKPAAT